MIWYNWYFVIWYDLIPDSIIQYESIWSVIQRTYNPCKWCAREIEAAARTQTVAFFLPSLRFFGRSVAWSFRSRDWKGLDLIEIICCTLHVSKMSVTCFHTTSHMFPRSVRPASSFTSDLASQTGFICSWDSCFDVFIAIAASGLRHCSSGPSESTAVYWHQMSPNVITLSEHAGLKSTDWEARHGPQVGTSNLGIAKREIISTGPNGQRPPSWTLCKSKVKLRRWQPRAITLMTLWGVLSKVLATAPWPQQVLHLEWHFGSLLVSPWFPSTGSLRKDLNLGWLNPSWYGQLHFGWQNTKSKQFKR